MGAVVIGQLKEMMAESVTSAAVTEALLRQDPNLLPEDANRLAEVLAPFVQTLTDGLAYAISLSKDPRCGRAVAHGTGSVLHYLLDDDDLLPESSFGIIGLIDDAYLVHMFLAQVSEAFPFAHGDQLYRPPTPREFDVVAALLPAGVAAALTRTCQSMVEVAAALFAPPALARPDEPSTAPALRIGEGLAANANGARSRFVFTATPGPNPMP